VLLLTIAAADVPLKFRVPLFLIGGPQRIRVAVFPVPVEY
jgi:hypothetical protein